MSVSFAHGGLPHCSHCHSALYKLETVSAFILNEIAARLTIRHSAKMLWPLDLLTPFAAQDRQRPAVIVTEQILDSFAATALWSSPAKHHLDEKPGSELRDRCLMHTAALDTAIASYVVHTLVAFRT